MNLESYLDLYEVLESDHSTPRERRTFGLKHSALKSRPLAQLAAWGNAEKAKLKRPRLSEILMRYLQSITLLLAVLAFVLGFFSSIALLGYNGHAPVNVIYFMAMVILVPLLTMSLSIVAMFRANSAHNMLVHLSPAYWMVQLLALLPSTAEKKFTRNLSALKINPLLANWLVIKRSQYLALSFSLGLFLGLLAMIATRDIAFAWSTTLSVSPETFHGYINAVAFPWRSFFPGAVPSVELIEQSQYYRLGEVLGKEMIDNASSLGEWWKFLAWSTLFYAIILRFLLVLLASFGFSKATDRAVMQLEGIQSLLSDMNEPVVSTTASSKERTFTVKNTGYELLLYQLKSFYTVVLGWAIDKDKLMAVNDSMSIETDTFFEVGGANSLEEDEEVLSRCQGEVLLYVKSWEPPTNDFVDFLEMLVEKTDKVVVVPVGTARNQYAVKASDLNVWARKLSAFKSKKVWLKA